MTFEPIPFKPRAWLRNGHLQTVFGNYLRRSDTLPEADTEFVTVSPATDSQPLASRVMLRCHWHPDFARRPAAILVHGLEGSDNSQYIRGNAHKLWLAGWNVVRMNMRNCGGTEGLSSTLYHSGLSGDVDLVMRHVLHTRAVRSISLVGYSMGGNLVLKLAGELGASAPPELHSVVGISPAVDLGPSADALHHLSNRVYEWKFLRALRQRFRRKALLFPQAFDLTRADYLHSLRDFDDKITAFYSGFTGADDYYHRAAAARVLDAIHVPTLILHALDDPFVRLSAETCAKIATNPAITLIETAHGGHCAFLAKPDPAMADDGYWAETTLRRFLLAHA